MKNLIIVFAIMLSVFGCSKPADVTPTVLPKDSVVVVPPKDTTKITPPIVYLPIKSELFGQWQEVDTYYCKIFNNTKIQITPTYYSESLKRLSYTKKDMDNSIGMFNKPLLITDPKKFSRKTELIRDFTYIPGMYEYNGVNSSNVIHSWYSLFHYYIENGKSYTKNYTTYPNTFLETPNSWKEKVMFLNEESVFVHKDTLYRFKGHLPNQPLTQIVTIYKKIR